MNTLREILLSKTFVVTCYCGNEIECGLGNPKIKCEKCGLEFGGDNPESKTPVCCDSKPSNLNDK